MLTEKLKIKSTSDDDSLSEYIFQSTGLFTKLYNNFELSQDKNYKKELLKQFNLFDVSMLDFCIDDVQTKLNQFDTIKKKRIEQIEEIEELLQDKNLKRRTRYKLQNKLPRLKKGIDKNICFGGKDLLRDITKAAKEGKQDLYEKYLAEYKSKRKLGIYLLGRACDKGNRKVNFELSNNRIVFKPSKNNHINIEFISRNGKSDLLQKLQEMADAKAIPITVRIDKNYIHLSYDEQLLHGYAFDINEYKRVIKKQNIKTKEGKTEIRKLFFAEQNERKSKGKLINRYLSVDINPTEISVAIADKTNDNEIGTVIHKQVFDLSKLSTRRRLSSTDPKQKYQNNKRKHEIRQVWKTIFELGNHYMVYNFSMEDLEFKPKQGEKRSKEANRKTKNIWHRELTTNLITKWTNINGLNLIMVNPAYSSFIGNILHNEYDPIAAALEIMRRGIVKYIKGNSLYPAVSSISQRRLIHLFGENVPSQAKFKNWVGLYKIVSSAGLRYRNKDKEIYRWKANYLNGCKRSSVMRSQCL